ncbi:MAG TPA: hypothetical protein VHD83_01355 [Puia sp.]|nr:hypothetical protein [Puia sp.]
MDSNRRRVMIVIVVVFVAILSFFAGKYSRGRIYTGTQDTNTGTTGSEDRAGVPPDSLHH